MVPIILIKGTILIWLDTKAAAVIRVPVRRRVIRVEVRRAVVRPVVPVATSTAGADRVGIDEVSLRPQSLLYITVNVQSGGKPPLALRAIHPFFWATQRQPPKIADPVDGA